MSSEDSRAKRKHTVTNYRSITIPINEKTGIQQNSKLSTLDYHPEVVQMKDINHLQHQNNHMVETVQTKQENKKKISSYPEPKIITVTPDIIDEKEKEFSEWTDPVDRFTNLITSNSMSPHELKESLENIILELKRNNDTYKDKQKSSSSSEKVDDCVLTYSFVRNSCYVQVNMNEFSRCELSINIFTYEGGKCLLDVQELYGEHFTFSKFFECFKSALKNANVVTLPSLSQKFFDSYGLDMDISLDAF